MDTERIDALAEFRKRAEALFPKMAWGLMAIMAAVFVFGVMIMSRPDAYQEHLMHPQATAGATWPDGSPRKPDDWWVKRQTAAHGGAAKALH